MFDAVIVAGGKGSRMGHVSKADLQVQGERLLDRVLRAASGARTRVVVGTTEVPDDVLRTMEEPPGSGPAAGVQAGLAVIEDPAEWTLVLACDLPDAPAAVYQLLNALPSAPDDVDGLCLLHPDGSLQNLAAIYRTAALLRAYETYGDPRNRSVHRLMSLLNRVGIDPGAASVADLDTPAELAAWNAAHPPRPADDPEAWDRYVALVRAALGLSDELDYDVILKLSRRVAHQGARPMAPVSSYILGLAVGAQPDAELPELLARLDAAIDEAPRPE